MKNRLLIGLCLVLVQSSVTFADGTNEVKRGTFPYMAFLYYPDETVVENGARFFRSAVLIKPEWLISSSIDHPAGDGFPIKTLLARAGAVTVDTKVTLNEDEDEQEREVIQIVRPTLHDLNMWYFTDITLLQTLLPFNMTSAVGLAPYTVKTRDFEQKCLILVYARMYGNSTEDKELMQMSVELVVPANSDNCGPKFSQSSMTCALDTEEMKSSLRDPNFCQGNAGGPLICDNEVTGLQTYINGICNPPHLYQLLSGWENLITCGTQKRCSQDYCSNTCTTIDKDPPTTEMTVSHTPETFSEMGVAVETSEVTHSVTETTENTATTTSTSTTQSFSLPSSESSTASLITTTTLGVPDISESLTTTTTTSPTTTTTSPSPTTKKRMKSIKTNQHKTSKTTKTTTTASTTESIADSTTEAETRETESYMWHIEDKKTKSSDLKIHDSDAAEEETESPSRRANIEAQVSHVTHKASAGSNIFLLKSLLMSVVVSALLI